MALATRCPNCQVLFRVVADQLKLRGGLVRCGACRHVFDAIGSLTYIEDSAASPPDLSKARRAAPPTLHAAAVAAPVLKAHAEEAERTPPPPAPEEVRRPDFSGPPTLLAPPDERGSAGQASKEHVPLHATRRVSRIEAKGDARAAADEREATGESRRARSASESAADAVEEPPRVVPPPGPRRRRRRPAREEIEADAHAPAEARAELTADDGEAEPAFLRETAARRRQFSVVFGGGSVLLAIVLAIQLAVIFRTEITTRWPQWRPMLVQLCGVVGCNVAWPMRAELLAVVGTELQAIPGTDVLELTAIVRNRANFKVALPAIEVTLTDTTNRTLARKVFAPVDYLASAGEPSSRIDEGLGASSDLTIRVAFEARGINAVGFVVYPFYL
jgi:predicted Zn finger-like uncharacterized protein